MYSFGQYSFYETVSDCVVPLFRMNGAAQEFKLTKLTSALSDCHKFYVFSVSATSDKDCGVNSNAALSRMNYDSKGSQKLQTETRGRILQNEIPLVHVVEIVVDICDSIRISTVRE